MSEEPNSSDADPVINLADYIAQQDALEENARAVLGSADADHCSYDKGYMKRQPLYSCRTCATDGKAGLCLACSLQCHDKHDLIELYTKRQFKCDCGNKKFGDFKCKLIDNKDEQNTENQYNDNFDGVYCVCKRPYPDTETDSDEEQLQCVVCEDWFHSNHLKVDGEVPDSDSFDEVICHSCMFRLPFLHGYSIKHEAEQKDLPVDVLASDSKDTKEGEVCKVGECADTPVEKAAFFATGWRDNLCKCSKCKYLVDGEDTIGFYESQADTHQDRIDAGLRAFGEQLNRTQQIELIHGYNDLKEQFTDFARTFAETDKVMTEDDVKVFFARLNGRKRQRLDPPANCHF